MHWIFLLATYIVLGPNGQMREEVVEASPGVGGIMQIKMLECEAPILSDPKSVCSMLTSTLDLTGCHHHQAALSYPNSLSPMETP